ncbi:MMPL family transporter [Nonomuraea sp. K274]|uniref:MMPL family transporter n=1 Tax=Nonomuraea cypriaca TaxID=1187855 RepID=A0A931F3Y9_9ACTN|nr:MMPL family transporter [Nonomuraea cypriaca]MBF8193130.1 MMPL family transporter [Nonomuraea cypriaca]
MWVALIRKKKVLLGVVLFWLALAAAVPMLAPAAGQAGDGQGPTAPPGAAESVTAERALAAAFPDDTGVPAIVVLRNPRGLGDADIEQVRRISGELSGSARPRGVRGVVSIITNPQAAAGLRAPDGTTTMIVVNVGLDPLDPAFGTTVESIRKIAGAGSGDLEIRVTGPAGVIHDSVVVFRQSDQTLLMATIVLVLVLLLAIYRSPVLAAVPLLAAGVAMAVSGGLGAGLARLGVISTSEMTTSIATVLLFGVGTDYCLFLIMRYREELATHADRPAAMAAALRRVGPAIGFSAGTVVAGLLVLLAATLPAFRSLGPYLAVSVAVMLAVALTFVPALIVLLGRFAFWPLRAHARTVRAGSLWGRVAAYVIRRPAITLITCLAILGGLAAGLTGYRENHDTLSGFRAPTDSARGQHLLAEAFPPGMLAPTYVLLDASAAPISDDQRRALTERIHSQVAEVPGVRQVLGPTMSASGHVARLDVVYADDPYGAAALDRTEGLRHTVGDVVDAHGRPGLRAMVGGESAAALDRRDAGHRDLLVISVLLFVLITLLVGGALKAVLAPLYLVATMVGSAAAALGATTLTMVTIGGQDGLAEGAVLYVIVFLVALGIDYNIMLAVRIRQETTVHGATEGLRRALTHTGGVITAAGLILAGTFAVLMSLPLDTLFQFGFALAVGILLDTFLVRALLVPALIHLSGPAIWLPSRLTVPAGPEQHPEPSRTPSQA